MGYVPSSPITALYTNTTPGTAASSAIMDDAVGAIVQTVNENYDAVQSVTNGLGAHKTAAVLDHPDQSVTTAKIKDANITTSKLADASVTTAKLAAGAVTSDRIATGAVGVNQLDPTLTETVAVAAEFERVNAQLADIAINVKTYGADPTGITDSTAAIQAALDDAAGKIVYIPSGVYKCSSTLYSSGSITSDNAVLEFHAVTLNALIEQDDEGDLLGFTIDGANVTNCQYGLFVNTDFSQKKTCYYDLSIKNISNTDNTKAAIGAVFYKASDASINLNSKLDIKIDVENVTATANTVEGDTGGASVGISVSFNGGGCDGQVIIRDSIIKNILPAEDSAGIHLTQGDHTSSSAKGQYTVRNCKVYNSKKRAFKIQAPNTVVEDCVSYGQDTTYGFVTYAYNTVFNRCKYLLGTAYGFQVNSANATISNSYAESSGQSALLYLNAGAHNAKVNNVELVSTAALATTANGLIRLNDFNNAVFRDVVVSNSNNSGSAADISGAVTVEFNNLKATGVSVGINLRNSTGKATLRNSHITALTNGVSRAGSTSQIIEAIDSLFNVGGIGLYLSGSGISAVADLDNCKVYANAHGILGVDGSRIINCEFESTGTTGIGIKVGNSVVRGNKVKKYGTGIDVTFTTTAELANNITVGSTTGYVKTSYTAYVDVNNDTK